MIGRSFVQTSRSSWPFTSSWHRGVLLRLRSWVDSDYKAEAVYLDAAGRGDGLSMARIAFM